MIHPAILLRFYRPDIYGVTGPVRSRARGPGTVFLHTDLVDDTPVYHACHAHGQTAVHLTHPTPGPSQGIGSVRAVGIDTPRGSLFL